MDRNDETVEPGITEVRLKNFMGFVDTDWIELKPITLLFGRNSSGKSALVRALRLLKQNIDLSEDNRSLLLFRETGIDLGKYEDFVHGHQTDLPITIGFSALPSEDLREVGDFDFKATKLSIQLEFRLYQSQGAVLLSGYELLFTDAEDTLFSLLRMVHYSAQPAQTAFSKEADDSFWSLESDYLDLDLQSKFSRWPWAVPVTGSSFVPVLISPGAVTDPNAKVEDYESTGRDFDFINRILHFFRNAVSNFLRSISYIGPLRDAPQRFYYVPQQIATRVGSKGQYSVSRLLGTPSRDAIERNLRPINDWLSSSSLKCKLIVSPVADNEAIFHVAIQEKDGLEANLQDVGFGISQILPILIESALSVPEQLVMIEQPEIHLHPEAQAELADLFVAMANSGTRFLLETHSEHLMLRLRRRIAESTLARLKEQDGPTFVSSDFCLLFVERKAIESELERIYVSRYGQLIEPSTSFKEFFDDDYREVAALARINADILALEEQGI